MNETDGKVVLERAENWNTGVPDLHETETRSRPLDTPAPKSAQPFRLAYDETILRVYRAIELRTPILRRKRGDGTLYVTDARVVFCARLRPRGTQRVSMLIQQTKLEDISGLAAYVTRRVSLVLAMLTFVLALGALGSLWRRSFLAFFVLLILACVCALLMLADSAKRGTTGILIRSRENQSSPIEFGFGTRNGFLEAVIRLLIFPVLVFFRSYDAFDVLRGNPAEDADQVVRELGALILDLQTRGTLAYDHWGMSDAAERARVRGTI